MKKMRYRAYFTDLTKPPEESKMQEEANSIAILKNKLAKLDNISTAFIYDTLNSETEHVSVYQPNRHLLKKNK